MFAGRGRELGILDRILVQTKHGNPNHFLLEGERGIGKSSLLLILDWVAKGYISSFDAGMFHFLTVNVELEPATGYSEIIRKVGGELQRELASHQQTKELLQKGWDFLKKWEIFGVKYQSPDVPPLAPYELLDDLTHTVSETVERLKGTFDGLLITIDEADKPPAQANLGEFAKLFTERLMKRGCNRVALGLAGLPQLLKKLRDSHESSPRIFEHIALHTLQPAERIEIIRKGLAQAKEKNGFETRITPEAENLISAMSEGYPSFVQQFAYCAFEEDKDRIIDVADAREGAFAPNGGLYQLGVKYFHGLYFEQVNSDEYRAVLQTMATHSDQWVTKAQIRKETKVKEYTLKNAISALLQRNIIVAQPGKKGVYRLPTKSFAAWIRVKTASPMPDATALLTSTQET